MRVGVQKRGNHSTTVVIEEDPVHTRWQFVHARRSVFPRWVCMHGAIRTWGDLVQATNTAGIPSLTLFYAACLLD